MSSFLAKVIKSVKVKRVRAKIKKQDAIRKRLSREYKAAVKTESKRLSSKLKKKRVSKKTNKKRLH